MQRATNASASIPRQGRAMKTLPALLIAIGIACPCANSMATCPTAPPTSAVYGYTTTTLAVGENCSVRTLEEAETIMHGSALANPASALAFTISSNYYTSPNSPVAIDYRPNGVLTGGGSVLTGGAQTVSPAYSVFTHGWTSTSALFGDQVAAAQSQFDATWHSNPLYSWARSGAATSTNQISGPPRQILGAGTPSGALVFSPASSTASGWGSTITINATQSMSAFAGSSETAQTDNPGAVTASPFTWNVQRQDNITCPAGGNVSSAATSTADACRTSFVKNILNVPSFNQTSGTCGIGDPCFPSNGNNLTIERGFSYGNISLALFYNSVRQTRPYGYIDRNWSHSLAKRVITEWSTDGHVTGTDTSTPELTTIVYVQDEQAHQEVFTKASNVTVPSGAFAFRSTSTMGNVLIYQPGAGTAPHFWELDRADGNTEVFDRTGRLTQIIYPGDPRKNLTLSYLGSALPTVPIYSETVLPRDEAFWRLGQVQDGTGRYVTFQYSNDQYLWLTDVIADDGTTTLLHFDFDSAHRLSKLTFADLTYHQYLYNEPTNIFVGGTAPPGIIGYWLTGVKDEAGRRYSTMKYDDWGRVVANWHGYNAEKVTISYSVDAAAATTVVTMPSGRQVTYAFAANEPYRHIGTKTDSTGTWRYQYYPTNRRLQQTTDPNGNITKMEYDADGTHVTAKTEAFGTPEQRRVETDWDATLNQPLERRVYAEPNDGPSSLESKVTYVYDPTTGRVVTRTKTNPVDGTIRRWTNTYCATTNAATGCVAGLLQYIDGPRTDVSDTTTFTYYTSTDVSGCATGSAGVCHHIGDVASKVNALGQITAYLSYDKFGHVTRMKDLNGVITDFQYNSRARLTDRIVRANADGSSSPTGDAVTHFDYDPSGMVSKTTDADGVWLSYVYDDAHRLIKISDRLGNSIDYCPGGVGSSNCLNAAGDRLIEQTKNSSGSLTRSLRRTYDTLGRLTQVLNASDVPVLGYGKDGYDADDNPIVSTDGVGIDTKHEYDGLNRVKDSIGDYNGTDAATQNARIDYEYDTRDNLRKIKDANSLPTTYDYDALDNLKGIDSPDSGHTGYGYDSAGNRTTQTDARGKNTAYTYDAINRAKTRTYPATPALNVTYTYDAVNSDCQAGEQSPKGRLTRMQDASGETRYCYGGHGNLRRKVQVTNSTTLTTLYTYSVGDRMTSITYPSGAIVNYGLDNMGRPSSLTWKASATSSVVNVITSTTYYPFGPVNVLTYGTGRTLTKLYDQDYAISEIISSDASGMQLGYGVDAMGNIVNAYSIGTVPRTPTPLYQRSYEYDALKRLTVVRPDGPGTVEKYTYNKTGDRLSASLNDATPSTYSYVASTHRLQSTGPFDTRSYDANGNQTSLAGVSYPMVYDDSNRLVSVKLDGMGGTQTYAYAYNGLGQRVSKGLPNGITSISVYDLGERLLSTMSAGSSGSTSAVGAPATGDTSTTELLYLGNLPVAQYQTATATVSTLYYIETDHLGAPRKVFNPATNVPVWSWDLLGNAFGSNAPNENPSGLGPYKLALRYPGQYFDAETGFNYNYYRDYEAATGRYIESDPAGLGGGLDTYAYVDSDPLRYFDRLGLGEENGMVCTQAGPVVRIGGDFSDGRCKQLRQCLEAHEQCHVDDASCNQNLLGQCSDPSSKNKLVGLPDWKYKQVIEVHGTNCQLECLDTALKHPDAGCRDKLERERDKIQKEHDQCISSSDPKADCKFQ